MRELRRIAFLLEDIALPSPAQQLLDRFLIGFSHNGEWQRLRAPVAVWMEKQEQAPLLQQRQDDFGLINAPDRASALREADAVVVAGAAGALCPPELLVRQTVELVRVGTPIFVYGLLASNPDVAADVTRLADTRRCPLLTGTDLPFAFRLPDVDVPATARLREALIVVQGGFPAAELDGLSGLLALLSGPGQSRNDVRRFRFLDEETLWSAADKGLWPQALFEAVISRSDTPQGNALLDGRTEDLVGLGLVPKLARQPRGWLLEHADGLRSALLVLNGVVADVNCGLRLADDRIVSAQLFRAPPPQQEHYSRMAVALLEFFTSGQKPWSLQRGLADPSLVAAMSGSDARSGAWLAAKTP
jgi:hypothetical protein